MQKSADENLTTYLRQWRMQNRTQGKTQSGGQSRVVNLELMPVGTWKLLERCHSRRSTFQRT